MDILTTGETRTNSEKLKLVCEFIKSTLEKFRENVNNKGLRYSNLYDFIQQKSKKGEIPGITDFNELQFREALNVLEDDNHITLNGHTSAPIVRLAQHD
jgi:hypothetical protein